MRPPILMGCQSKSGASLLRTIVGRHPDIFGGDGFETHWFSDEIIGSREDPHTRRQKWLREWYEVSEEEYGQLGASSSSGVDFFGRFMESCARREGKQRWLEKTPDNLLHFDLIMEAWPDCQFIHAVREFKDIFASWKTKKLGSLKTLSVKDFVEKVKGSYHQIEHLIGQRTEQYAEVRYEDLVHSPKAVIQDVLSFLKEPYVEGMEDYRGDSREFENVRRIIGRESNTSRSLKKRIFTSSVGQWKEILAAEEVDVIDTELASYRERLGYS